MYYIIERHFSSLSPIWFTAISKNVDLESYELHLYAQDAKRLWNFDKYQLSAPVHLSDFVLLVIVVQPEQSGLYAISELKLWVKVLCKVGGDLK